MSLSRLFKKIAAEENGLFSAFRKNYHYKLISLEKLELHYALLQTRFTSWQKKDLERIFPIKIDDRGREYIYTFGNSMPCHLESNFVNHPVTSGFALVPEKLCAKCPHKKKFRRKYFCEKLRDKNLGLTKSIVEGALKKVEEIMK